MEAGRPVTTRSRVVMATALALVLAGVGIWFAFSDGAVYATLHRLYADKDLLRATVQRWGVLAPLAFIAIQALQVVIAPIPGDVTGFLGGFLFGQWLGFLYSTIGLTIGSLLAFAIGRALGAPFVRGLVEARTWERLGFIIEAEGALLCFIIYLVPGLPKDIVCYLFGLSPMPLWVFAVASTLGRIPGTWVLSAQGAQTATGHYHELLVLTAVTLMVAVPLYYYRHRIVAGLQGRTRGETPR